MDAISSTPSPTPDDDESLPNDVASCHQIIRTLRSRVAELESKVEQLEAKLDKLLKRYFAARSERSKQARKEIGRASCRERV